MEDLENNVSWQEFIKKFREEKSNMKLGETVRAYWGILSLLLDNHSMEGLYPQEIIKKLNKMSSKPTILKALNQLRVWGFIEKTDKRWIANRRTGMSFKQIDDSFNPVLFARPDRINPKTKETIPGESLCKEGNVAKIVYFNNDKSLGSLSFTGSAFLNEPLKQKNVADLINSGHVIEFRGIFKPAGGQPPGV
jgi:hypothetical protein